MSTVNVHVNADPFSETANMEENVLANHDLPIEFIRATLIAKEMPTEPFKFKKE